VSLHGPRLLGDGRTVFRVWAPAISDVTLVLADGREASCAPVDGGYHEVAVRDAGPGTRYRYLLDGAGPFADPASRWQPDGVDGPSAVVGARRRAGAAWRGLALSAQVICEIHVGTFSPVGTFAGVVEALDDLADAGYTAIECMPLAEFPGTRNWGYDGVFPFAVQSSYGGPEGLTELTAAAHERGIAVLVDVVYNHVGPEGAVHGHYGPYFTDRYRTPWGDAVNVDGPGSDAVRAYFIEHACYLVRELGVDGLRLDAVHEIVDTSASPFLAELTSALAALGRALGRTVTVTAESPANDPRLTTPVTAGGLGCDASWDDDLHHALRSTLTGEHDRYFEDFSGIDDLAVASARGWVLTGRRSRTFGRRHGVPLPVGATGDRLVVFAQNHDQVGNAGWGKRLAAVLPLDAQYPIAATILLAPFVPLRFMGEEYGEMAPFHFFTSHSDPALVEAVRRGRALEHGGTDADAIVDPADPTTFEACRLDRSLTRDPAHRALLDWQRELLAIRRAEPSLGSLEPSHATTQSDRASATVSVLRRANDYLAAPVVATVCRFAGHPSESAGSPASPGAVAVELPLLAGHTWQVRAAHGAPGLDVGAILDGLGGSPTIRLESYAALVLVASNDLVTT
jgi:maltooligosyltrehalose trehalohydrolase